MLFVLSFQSFPMRFAFVSDIHANRQAWQAVLTDLSCNDVDVVICLGDVVGYGPAPADVLESVYQHVDYFVLGNHDAVVAGRLDPECFNDSAREIIDWTCAQLGDAAIRFFGEVPMMIETADFACAHADFADPDLWGYLLEPADAGPSFEATQAPLLFYGHTHEPCVMQLDPEGFAHYRKHEIFSVEPGWRFLVNVGSVGDPRDGDLRASYCIYDKVKQLVQFRKVPFDIDAYAAEIKAAGIPTLPYVVEMQQEKTPRRVSDLLSFHPPAARQPDAMDANRRQRIEIDSETLADIREQHRRGLAHATSRGENRLPWILASLTLLVLCLGLGAYIWFQQAGNSPAEPDDRLLSGLSQPSAPGTVPPIFSTPQSDTPPDIDGVESNSVSPDVAQLPFKPETPRSEFALETPTNATVAPPSLAPIVPAPAPTRPSLIETPARPNYPDFIGVAAQQLLQSGIGAALIRLEGEAPERRTATELLRAVNDVPRQVAESFRSAIDQTIQVDLKGKGPTPVRVQRVADTTIVGLQPLLSGGKVVGSRELTFQISELSNTELLRRASDADLPVFAMWRGLRNFQAKQPLAARQLFFASDTPIGRAAAEHLGNEHQQRIEAAARATWQNFQRSINEIKSQDDAAWLSEELNRFREVYGLTEIGRKMEKDLTVMQKTVRVLAANNYVVNGDFEAGELAPWIVHSHRDSAASEFVSDAVRGQSAVRIFFQSDKGKVNLEADNNAAVLEQELELPPRTLCLLTAHVRVEEPSHSKLSIRIGESYLKREVDKETGDEWTAYHMLFLPRANRETLEISVSQKSHSRFRTMLVDEVRVQQTRPESGPPTDAVEFNGHRYQILTLAADLTAATEWCQTAGGHLLTINSREENSFIHTLLKDRGVTQRLLLGLKHVGNNRYEWITGEPMTYENWGDRMQKEPQHAGAAISVRTSTHGMFWNHATRPDGFFFICEWESGSP